MPDRAIEAVLFDYGGVLATSQWDALATFEAARGHEPGQLFRHFGREHPDHPGTPAWHLLETGQLGWSDFVALAVEASAADADGPALDAQVFEPVEELMPLGAHWTVVDRARRLRADGYRTGVLTNNVREYGRYWRSTIPIDLFDVVIDSCEVGLRKPDPAIYRLAAERLGVPTGACVLLDDSADNVAGAEAVGMRAILVGADLDAALEELDRILGDDSLA